MKKDFFAIYDALTAGMDESGGRIRAAAGYSRWSLAETDRRLGIAMTTEGDSVPPLFPAGLEGLCLKEAAEAAKSWNFVEAGMGLAAANAWYNTEERMERLGCYLPFETFYTAGLDFRGKTVGLIGHLHGPEEMYSQSAAVHIMEKHPHPGDYPDSACEYLLPRCDIVLITGSSLVNKTLPRLLELCRDAYTVVTGPSTPMCPALLELGIDRLAGLVITDPDGMRAHAAQARDGSPYPFGKPFMLAK